MEQNTLYYTLSAIPQILAATSAVLAAFIHFRLTSIHNILVGDGLAALDRLGELGYLLDKGPADRLRDGIHRKSIAEIKEILEILKDIEIKEGYTKSTRPTGLTYLYEDRFCQTEKFYSYLKTGSLLVIGVALLSILSSTISLSQIDCIIANKCQYAILNINIILFILSIIFSFAIVTISFTYKTIYESIKKRENTIRKNKKADN